MVSAGVSARVSVSFSVSVRVEESSVDLTYLWETEIYFARGRPPRLDGWGYGEREGE